MTTAASSVPVLMYHHVSPNGGAYCVHPERFREQLAWMREQGINLLTGTEFSAFAKGEWKPNGPAALISFDDGWLDNWAHALPILKEFDAPAIFFIVSSWPGDGACRDDLVVSGWTAPRHREAMDCSSSSAQRDSVVMRWSELLASEATGLVQLHSHSHSHGAWWHVQDDPLEVFRHDLIQSINELHDHTGSRPLQFCWPRGEFTARMRDVAEDLGFAIQHSTLRGANEYGNAAHHVIRRLHVEDKPLSWFQSRIRLYSQRHTARALGWGHQELQRRRMRRAHPDQWARYGGLGREPWRLV